MVNPSPPSTLGGCARTPARFASWWAGRLARAGRMFVMALAGALGGPRPKVLRHEDESAEVGKAKVP